MLVTIRMSATGAAVNMILFSIGVMVLSGGALGCSEKRLEDQEDR